MNEKEFRDGMAILQGAAAKKFPDITFPVWWEALKDEFGGAFLSVCRELAKTEKKLDLPTVIARLAETKTEREAENFEHELWADKMRRLYNASTSLPTREERYAFADRLNFPDRNALADAVVLYETIWPQICRENPAADRDTKIRLSLERLISHDPRIKHAPAPGWYKKKYRNQTPASAETEPTLVKFEIPSPPPSGVLHQELAVAPSQTVAPPEDIKFTEENLPF